MCHASPSDLWGLRMWFLEVGQTMKCLSGTKSTQKSFMGIYKHFKFNLVVAVSKGPDHLKLLPETQRDYSLLNLIFEKQVKTSASEQRVSDVA